MFDNTQRTEINYIDERIFPNGITVLWRFAQFCGKCGAFTPKEETLAYLKLLVKELEDQQIPIMRIGEDMRYWIIHTENIKL